MIPTHRFDGTGAYGEVERADYLIDRFPVRYVYGGGWVCGCADFMVRDACKHTREAAGRRAAQADIARHLRAGSPLRGSASLGQPTSYMSGARHRSIKSMGSADTLNSQPVASRAYFMHDSI